jgi:hypothetical protein
MTPSTRDNRSLTRGDFTDTIADLKSDLRDDLRGITEQLAALNGRTRKGEIADAEVRVQIGYLQAQLAAHEARAAAARPVVAEPTPAPVAYALSPKAQAALVGSAVLVLTVLFKLIGAVTSVVGAKALELLLKK